MTTEEKIKGLEHLLRKCPKVKTVPAEENTSKYQQRDCTKRTVPQYYIGAIQQSIQHIRIRS